MENGKKTSGSLRNIKICASRAGQILMRFTAQAPFRETRRELRSEAKHAKIGLSDFCVPYTDAQNLRSAYRNNNTPDNRNNNIGFRPGVPEGTEGRKNRTEDDFCDPLAP